MSLPPSLLFFSFFPLPSTFTTIKKKENEKKIYNDVNKDTVKFHGDINNARWEIEWFTTDKKYFTTMTFAFSK